MSDPVQIVTDFVDTINEGPEGFAKAVAKWFTPQTVWENVGMGLTTGPEQALGLVANMSAGGIATFRIENLAIAAQGAKVLTERVDYMIDGAGATKMAVRLMGVFEVGADGKLVRWTDYFDASLFKS